MSKPPKFTRNRAARNAFETHRQAIETRVKAGDLIKEIYRDLKIPGSYEQFTRKVAKMRASWAVAGTAESAMAPAPLHQAPAGPPPTPAVPPREDRDGPRRVAPPADLPPWDPSNIDRTKLFGRRTDDK